MNFLNDKFDFVDYRSDKKLFFPIKINPYIVKKNIGNHKNNSELIDNFIPFIKGFLAEGRSIIEVNGKNKPGLLYKLTNEIKNLGLQTQYASVSTFGNRVVDVFYVKDIFGMKVDSKKRENLIKEKINSIL